MPSSAPAPSAAPSPAAAPVPPSASKLEAFLDKNFRMVVIVCIGLIAASALVGFLRYRGRMAAEEAAQAATAAKTVDDCDIVIQKHKGSIAAGNALLTKAKLLWEQNKKDQSVAALREFVANHTGHPFFAQAQLGLATRLDSMGANEAKEARTIYEQIVKTNKSSEVAGLAQLRIGDQLWIEGKADDAKKIYDEQPRQFIGQYKTMIDERVKWLGADLPTKEVDAPKPPPDAIKAPTPGAAPAINLTPGKNGTSLPLEIKADPIKMAPPPAPAPAPAPGTTPPTPPPAGTPAPAPANGAKPTTPAPAPSPADGTIKPQPINPAGSPKLQVPAPVIKLEPPKTDSASTPPVVVPPAPAPATPAPAPAPAPPK